MTTALEPKQALGREVTIKYRNWRGDVSLRRIVPDHIWYGVTEWHSEGQWLLDAYDVDKKADRSFAIRDILEFGAIGS